jgi:protein ImuB
VTEEASAPRRYLAAFLPLLSAERALKTNAAPRDTAFVLIAKVGGAVRLAAVDAQALALGIAPGLTLADARARVPGLLAVAHDVAANTALLEWLADGCKRYSPMVAVNRPHSIVLDITGCM